MAPAKARPDIRIERQMHDAHEHAICGAGRAIGFNNGEIFGGGFVVARVL